MTDIHTHTQGIPNWVTTRDGRKLYTMTLPGVDSTGTTPTVVFEAGAASSRSSWGLVQPLVGEFAQAVVYDRSGLGLSPPDIHGRTLDRMADDLNDLLDNIDASKFILVGHSAGGPIVRLAAARRLDRITGLVLVDPTDEASDSLFTPAFRRFERVAGIVGKVLARLGLLRLLFRSYLKVLPLDVRSDFEREGFKPSAIHTATLQARTFIDELFLWREQPPNIGDTPLTIISGGLKGDGVSASARLEINAAHMYRAKQYTHGRVVVANKSGHNILITEPEIIAEEIQRIVQGKR